MLWFINVSVFDKACENNRRIWLHFSLFQNIIGHFLKLRKDNNRISGGWFVAAACSPDLRIFSFISKKEKRNINCCALSVNIYTWTVFASLNRIANWSVIEWCWEPASITHRIFSISWNQGKLINWRKARSWPVLFYHFVFHEIALEWSQQGAPHTKDFSVIWFWMSGGLLAC